MVLVGPSLGAAVAIDFTVNYPEAVSKLIFISASVYAESTRDMSRVPKFVPYAGDGMWVIPSEYSDAEPDTLRNFAESIAEEMNSKHAEDVHRIYNIYVESDFQVTDVKMIWVDRLGFDLHVQSGEGTFAVRIPFSREVSDEKGVKSSFNMMSHHAWEVEKSYAAPEFERVQFLKKIR
ncbi:hypothetical protein ABZP36_011508 [Zizania latifolia]